jgi:N-acetyl-alpha-D-glucosaminyl L-malate synthase BshA
MKKRVVQILHTLTRAGTEKLVYDLSVANLEELETTVVCLDQEGPLADELRAKGIPVFYTHRRPGLDVHQIARIAEILKTFKPQIVHCHQYTPFFYGCLAGIWARQGRVIFTEHGRHFPDVVGWKRRLANRFLIRRADCITAVCDFSRNQLIRNEGLPASRVEVIYNGVDTSRFENRVEDRDRSRKKFKWPQEVPVVVQVGTFRAVKDQATAIRAFRIVQDKKPGTVLVFVGDGPDLAPCQKLVADLKLEAVVQFLGQRSDIPEILAGADVMLMSSLSEAHSVSLLEAMASRLPVVATRVGGIPETVLEGETGFLAPAGDAEGLARNLLKLLADPALCRRMGQAGYERVESRFQQAPMHRRYLEIYRSLSENGKRA